MCASLCLIFSCFNVNAVHLDCSGDKMGIFLFTTANRLVSRRTRQTSYWKRPSGWFFLHPRIFHPLRKLISKIRMENNLRYAMTLNPVLHARRVVSVPSRMEVFQTVNHWDRLRGVKYGSNIPKRMYFVKFACRHRAIFLSPKIFRVAIFV